jgi:hypothetical protein
VNKLEQSSYCNDLILCGIPELEKDDRTTSDIVVQFINHIDGPKITNKDIRSAYRIIPRASPSQHKDGKKPPKKILVKFHSTQLRDATKLSIRSVKKESPSITFEKIKVNFYAADYLSPYYNQLLYSAKDFAKNNNYSRVWVSNSNVMIKKSNATLPTVIKSLDDLQKL